METIILQAVQLYENANAVMEKGDYIRSETLHLECIALSSRLKAPIR